MNRSPIGSPIRALVRLTLYAVWSLASISVFVVCRPLGQVPQRTLILWHHGINCRIAGFKVEVRGQARREHPTLFVCNHVSYFDIPIVGALVDGCFVAKSEVRTWPVIGIMARLQRSVFIERMPRRAADHRNELLDRLEGGDNLILFPEGTSSDGNGVLPFKSSLFAIAQSQVAGQPVVVQPVSIAYTKLDGMPLGRYLRPFFAWYGDMELAGHLWQALALGRCTVVVEFHPPVTIAEFGSRKALSEHCQRAASEGVAAAISDRPTRRLEVPETAAA
ncbi:MAG: lysophospholipid acyltransferase family protein [Kiloniellales bacterium]|nr:lysophospholipid acyltransferase family protein [Kiloniellales bacterium]